LALESLFGHFASYDVSVAVDVVLEDWLSFFEVFIKAHHSFFLTTSCCVASTKCVVDERFDLVRTVLGKRSCVGRSRHIRN